MRAGAGIDFACASAAFALAAGYYLAADAIPTSLLSDGVGADGVPKLLAIILAALAGALALRTLRPGGGRSDGGARAIAFADHARPIGLTGLGMIYVALAPLLGYAVTLALLIAATLVYFGARNPVMIALNAIGGATLLWLTFAKLLGIAMPVGSLARRLL